MVTTQAIPGAELAGLIRPGVSELSQWGGLSDPCMILAPFARFLHLLPGVQEWLSPPPRPLHRPIPAFLHFLHPPANAGGARSAGMQELVCEAALQAA